MSPGTGTPNEEDNDLGMTDRKLGIDFMCCFLLKSFSNSGGDGFGNINENNEGFPPSVSTKRPNALPTPRSIGKLTSTINSIEKNVIINKLVYLAKLLFRKGF